MGGRLPTAPVSPSPHKCVCPAIVWGGRAFPTLQHLIRGCVGVWARPLSTTASVVLRSARPCVVWVLRTQGDRGSVCGLDGRAGARGMVPKTLCVHTGRA